MCGVCVVFPVSDGDEAGVAQAGRETHHGLIYLCHFYASNIEGDTLATIVSSSEHLTDEITCLSTQT